MKRFVLFGVATAILCAGLLAVFVGGIFYLTRPVVDSSEQFLALLGEGRIDEAYASTADAFRAQQDEKSFTTAVRQFGLADYSSVVWHSRQIENQDGSVEGTVITKTSATKPVAIRLIWESGRWAVVGVRYGGEELLPRR